MRPLSSTVARCLPLALALAGCDDGASSDPETRTAGLVPEGSPAAIGLVAFLNDPTTSARLLDIDVGLDKRAADALIAHRDGADGKNATRDDDRFDTVAEVDAVAYVGTSALDKLVAWSRDHGYQPAGDAVLGTWDGVDFTVSQAAATLALANSATAQHLDQDLHLDARAVRAIVAARPVASIEKLSKLSYVGTTALRILKTAATAHPTQPTGAVVAAHLGAASQGLYHTSESDYPFVVVRVPGRAAVDASNVKDVIAALYTNRPDEPTLAERVVEVTTLAQLFDRYTVTQDWWEDFQREQQPAFTALRAVFEGELSDVKVFRLGRRSGDVLSGAIDVFILGVSADGEIVGLSTISVET